MMMLLWAVAVQRIDLKVIKRKNFSRPGKSCPGKVPRRERHETIGGGSLVIKLVIMVTKWLLKKPVVS